LLPSGVSLSTIEDFEVSNSTQYEDMKCDTKCRKWGGFGVPVVRVTQGYWK